MKRDFKDVNQDEWVSIFFFVDDPNHMSLIEDELIPHIENIENDKLFGWFSAHYSEPGMSKQSGNEHLQTDHHFKLVLWRKPEWKNQEIEEFVENALKDKIKAKLHKSSDGKTKPTYNFEIGTPPLYDNVADVYLSCFGNKIKRMMEKEFGRIIGSDALFLAMHFAIQKQGYGYEAEFGRRHLLNGLNKLQTKVNKDDITKLLAALNNIFNGRNFGY